MSKLTSEIDSIIIDMILEHYNIKHMQGRAPTMTDREFDKIVESAKEIYFKKIMVETPKGTEGSA
tara:strand:+ start:108 stop:302 length:195 start_codon:yes stop_codon:yes gene_type:complete